MGLHHLYNEHLPCISSSHLHREVRLRADRNIPFSSREAVSATGSKQNPKESPRDAPLTPPLTHTHLKAPGPGKTLPCRWSKAPPPSGPERCWDSRGVRPFTIQVPAEETRKGWCDAFWAPPFLVQKSSAESCPQIMGEDELEGTGNETTHPIQPNRVLCPEDPGPLRGHQSGMWEGKQGYKALNISLMHCGHPGQSGGSTGGWGPWCAESQAPWVPGSQCGESKELMKMLGNMLLCIRLRTKLWKPHLLENWGHLGLLLCFGKKIISNTLMITAQGKANVLFQDGKVGEMQELGCVQ